MYNIFFYGSQNSYRFYFPSQLLFLVSQKEKVLNQSYNFNYKLFVAN